MADRATDWYWFVGGDKTQVYSSARQSYVPVSDSIYQAWLQVPPSEDAVHVTAEIDTEHQTFAPLINW